MNTYFVAHVDDLTEGEKMLVEVQGLSIGLFNVNGEYHALYNRCPHIGAPLCKGRVVGTTLPSDVYEYEFGREGEILLCPWHGWEFEIKTGVSLVDEKVKVRKYDVVVEDGKIGIKMNR